MEYFSLTQRIDQVEPSTLVVFCHTLNIPISCAGYSDHISIHTYLKGLYLPNIICFIQPKTHDIVSGSVGY